MELPVLGIAMVGFMLCSANAGVGAGVASGSSEAERGKREPGMVVEGLRLTARGRGAEIDSVGG